MHISPFGESCARSPHHQHLPQAVLYSAESNYTHALGVHCRANDDGDCTMAVQHKNQEDAATAW